MAENRELALVLKLVADNFQSELKKSGGALGEFNSFIKDWKTQLVAAGTALFAIAKSTANYGEEALKTSQRLGLSVQATTALQHAANLADVPVVTLERSLKTLAQNAVEASRGTGDGAKLFQQLGLSATDTHGKVKPLDTLFFEFQDRLKGVTNQAQFVDVGVKAFGKSFLEIVPLIKQGSTETKALMEEAKQLGLVMSQEDAEAANRFNDELKKLQAQVRGMTLTVGKELIPVITELLELFRGLHVGSAVGAGLSFLHERFIGLNVLLKELQANAQFLSWTGKDTLSFDGLKARIAEIEAEGQRKLFESRHPGVLTGEASAAQRSALAGGSELAPIADQEKLAKALVDIWQSGNRALEIRTRLQQEAIDFEQQLIDASQEFDAEIQEEAGRRIVESTSLQIRIREAAMAQERDQLIANEQAWVAYYDQLGGDAEHFLAHKTALLEAQLAKELELTAAQSQELLAAWQARDSARADALLQFSPVSETQKETVELNTMRQALLNAREASGSFVEGWADGMRKYVRDTRSGFGLAADMARRTAQTMEAGFKTFFFDAMDGKIKSFKDLLRSLLDFTKQIVSQVAAQLVTNQLVRVFSGLATGPGTPAPGTVYGPPALGQNLPGFAGGGSFVVGGRGGTDSVPVAFMATPGEQVSVRTPGQQQGGGVNVIVHNYGRQEVETSSRQGADGRQTIIVTVREMMKGLIQGGEMDWPMGQRYGLNPSPWGR